MALNGTASSAESSRKAKACGEEGSGRRRKPTVKPASRKQEVSSVLLSYEQVRVGMTERHVSQAFAKVATGSGKIGELVAEIAAASQEQAQGIDQINSAVADLDKVVQQNAAHAEETASASSEMDSRANELTAFVSELQTFVGGATS